MTLAGLGVSSQLRKVPLQHADLAFPAASAGSAVLLKRTQGAKSANNCQLGVCVLHPLLAELALFW
jgi:hypothetical protein